MSDDEFSNLYNTRIIDPPQVSFDEKTSVFIKNITNLTRQDIIDFFKPCHPIVQLQVKGNYGYVQFKDARMKELALKLNLMVCKGKSILVTSLKKSIKI
ncbi:hypothetical protein TUBRATIS_000280 [Tubulinosema ratisbonensis]|uniref:RRM domain-containing protein n=1 Tax=Tubulinosema ratisbonensis TaxID=291195 RepID=A0A437AQG0_9MICR|nr:hypothetical protein TUBRATIS_000280 [Tubulinosema ratisbonensis]